jgi:DnaK suppressor protein
MDVPTARERLRTERAQVLRLLTDRGIDQREDHAAELETGDISDPAQPLEAQGVDDALAVGLRDRLAAIDRALKRLDEGSYGRSIRSGTVIPDERLEADPAAELTVEEQAAAE